MRRVIRAMALEYVSLTLKCVQCHKYVRGSPVAAVAAMLPGPVDPGSRAERLVERGGWPGRGVRQGRVTFFP